MKTKQFCDRCDIETPANELMQVMTIKAFGLGERNILSDVCLRCHQDLLDWARNLPTPRRIEGKAEKKRVE